ncbi:MAG: hypothetical protein ACSHW1_12780 [Yoonia sp.]|uniref:hypothetical protein n=1 Tax=Yoonia sp. TaxID=2212373 RepID=UPI003EF2DA17
MAGFFSTLLLGLIAAVIGALIQQRTWRHRSLVELKEKEYSEARKTVEEISRALDNRLTAQRSFTYRALEGKIDDKSREEYRKALSSWMGDFSSNKSKLYHSFGKRTVNEFEDTIQLSLQKASAIVSLGLEHGPNGLCTRDRNSYLKSEDRLNFIQHIIYKFLNELNDRIKNGEVGRTKAINNLSENDLSMLSRLYLIRRLLGMEGNIRSAYW